MTAPIHTHALFQASDNDLQLFAHPWCTSWRDNDQVQLDATARPARGTAIFISCAR